MSGRDTTDAAPSGRAADGVARLVLLHGFTQHHHLMHPLGWAVADRLAVAGSKPPSLAFVDLPGHGLSVDDRSGSIDDVAPQVASLGGPGTWIGYSMGGRVALAAAAAGAPEIERLVLIGATPGIEDDGERAERRRLDDERAAHLETVGVDVFLAEWLALPLFAGLPADPDGAAHRRRNTAPGLAHSLREHGTGRQTPRWDRLGSITVPVLVMAGEQDAKFTAIGHRMADLLPDGVFVAVPGAGHAAHLEAPAATADAIAAWIAP